MRVKRPLACSRVICFISADNCYSFTFQVIVLDTDVTFATDIAELWKIFSILKRKKVLLISNGRNIRCMKNEQ